MKFFYLCDRNGQCKGDCGPDCFYTSSFYKSKLYRHPIKPASITFARSKLNNDFEESWWEIDPNHSYPLPDMTIEHLTTTYHDLEDWVFSNDYKKLTRNPAVTIQYADGSKKRFKRDEF